MNETSSANIDLDNEIEILEKEKLVKCPKCDRTFATVGHLRMHFHKLHPELRITSCLLPILQQCDLCKKIYSSEQKLKRHCCVDDIKGPAYKCNECGTCFTSKSYFVKHYIKIHISDRIYECKFCDKEFTSRSCLIAHTQVHKKEIISIDSDIISIKKEDRKDECLQKKRKSFNCEICNKTVVNLKSHILTHAQEKCFQCDLCKKFFMNSFLLKQHYRSHTNEKPFMCEICKRHYSTKTTLSAHYLIHTQEKPYVCDICNAGFKARKLLETHHSRMHTTPEFYTCKICNGTFKRKGNFTRHYKLCKKKKNWL